MNILSGDPPRGRALQILLILIVLALAGAPFLFHGAKALNVAAKTCVMILLVASYDLLLGYTGVVSFAHVMFFGVGAYGVGLMLYALGASWGAILAGLAAAAALSLALALAIGLFSLRVQSIFFAMVTLAVAYAFNVLASQLSWLTGGEDGRSFKVPEVAAARLQAGPRQGLRRRNHRQDPELLSCVRRRRDRLSRVAEGGELAVRPRPAGDPREPVPRRGAGLSHRLPSHARHLHLGARRDARRRLVRALAALRRARTPRSLFRSRSTSW